MKNNHAMMLLTLVLAFGLTMSGCHADSECVGNCPSDDTQEEGDGPDQVDQETDGDGPDVPDGVDGEGVDTGDVIDDEAADGPDGCSPCEYLFPNCVEDHTCCADPYGTETCNGLDDDCDGEVDEDINFDEDPRNCGECGNDCRLPHAEVRCQEGDCVFIRCLTYYQDCVEDDPLDPDTLGCEYYCVTSADDDAVCDELDNDCDCRVDEDIDLTTDIDHCGNCSTRCRFPHADAECYSPDGTPENAVCRIAACHDGYWNDDGILTNGCEYECTPCEYLEGACVLGHTCCTMDGAETCNSLDDDCDGDTDDGNPGGGASCGTDEGECVSGITTCTDGTLVCGGDTGPAMETCDGLDNDCDGTPDEPDDGEIFLPDENVPCGETRGDCEPGLTVCVGGSLDCQGGVGPASETCDGHDNDCDGSVDELPLPGVGLGCGTDTGECVAGTTACQAGGIVCSGETGPVPEVCDGLDNDCNGTPDDPWDFDNDPENCGGCGTRCADVVGPHTVYICDTRVCTVIGCEDGYWDNDANPLTCEYPCTYTGDEICDGQDNDCNGLTDLADSGMAPIANFCNQTGPCAGSAPQCTTHSGVTRWYCNYNTAVVNLDTDFLTILPEDNCDNLDNDCDGDVDETFPSKGTECSVGVGACRNTGTWVCNTSQTSVICNASAGTPGTETCNGIDDDCDGIPDNFDETAWAVIGAVPVSGSGAQYSFQYESSRPTAASCDAGTQQGSGVTVTTKACSRTGVQPWANVDWVTAREACCNLNNDNVCHYDGVGNPQRWNLCLEPHWEEICESQGHNYLFPYGDTYFGAYCNGNDYDTNCPCPGPTCPSTTGDQDEIMPSGSMASCCSTWGSQCVYDMSGNVKEWTYTETSPGSGYHVIRGGSNNSPAAGMTCQFDFTLGSESFAFYNLGFRCCYY
jgi:hypothetical protein